MMSPHSTCRYSRLNAMTRVFIPIAPRSPFFIDKNVYPDSNIGFLDEETADAITAAGSKNDPPLWYPGDGPSHVSNTVTAQSPLSTIKAQPLSPLHQGVVYPADLEISNLDQPGDGLRCGNKVPQAPLTAPLTSSTSVHALSAISLAHDTSVTSATSPLASSDARTPAKKLMAQRNQMSASHQEAAENTSDKDLHDRRCEYASDGEISESGWTTASGGMAFSLSSPDGKPCGRPIFQPNGVPTPFPIQARPPIRNPKTFIRDIVSCVDNGANNSKDETTDIEDSPKYQKREVKAVEGGAQHPVRSVPRLSQSRPSHIWAAEKQQRTYCEKYNAQVQSMFAGMSSKYPQPASTRAVREARKAESEARKAEMTTSVPTPGPVGEKTMLPASTIAARTVVADMGAQHKAAPSAKEMEIPPNGTEYEPDHSSRPNSTNGWINWKPKPKTGPLSARPGNMTMSEYQAAIAYRPQGEDLDYDAIQARAAEKRFTGPAYRYYGQSPSKKRKPKYPARKPAPQEPTLPLMFPDVLPWREVVPQPPNTTGKRMPELDFCGEPMQKGRGFDGTIKHWGVPTRDQDHVPFIEINAIASEYTTDCDKDSDDPTRKPVRLFPPPKTPSVSENPPYAQIEGDYSQVKKEVCPWKWQEKAKAPDPSVPLRRLMDSELEKNRFTLGERVGIFLHSLNPDFPDPPDMSCKSCKIEPAAPAQRPQAAEKSNAKEIIINCVEDELKRPRREPYRQPIKGRADMEWYRTPDGCWSQRFPLGKKDLPALPDNKPTGDW